MHATSAESLSASPANRPAAGEHLLWMLIAKLDERHAEMPSDEQLHAYREQSLPAAEVGRVETALARDAGVRQRLVQVAGLEPSSPPTSVRQRYLFALPRRPKTVRRTWWSSAAAAIIAALMLGYGWISPTEPAPAAAVLAPNADFVMRVESLVQTRSVDGEASKKTLYADSPFELVIEPATTAVAGLEYGLYIRQENQLRRRYPNRRILLETYRDTATFSAEKAADVLGPEPGSYQIYVVVAEPGALPESVSSASRLDAIEALESGRADRWVGELQIELLPASE